MPKAKKIAKPAKSSLAANKRRRRARKNPGGEGAIVSNPPLAADFMNVLLPGFGGYAATRVVQRIVYQLVQKRWPRLGKHAHVLAGAAGFGAVWFFAHKVKQIAKYHDGIVMGSGIAAIHGVAAAYLPKKYAWLVTDPKPEDAAAAKLETSVASAAIPARTTPADEYDFLESQLDALENSSRPARTIRAPKPSARPIANALQMATGADDGSELDPDLSDALDGEDVDDLYSGAFALNN